MRYGISVLGNRIAPRCTFADSVLLVVVRRNVTRREDTVILANHSLLALVELLSEYHVDTLVCGGISRENREFLNERRVNIIDNVACPVDEAVEALKTNTLYPGYGFTARDVRESTSDTRPGVEESKMHATAPSVDCLACSDRRCLRGDICPLGSMLTGLSAPNSETNRMLEAALDISCERERTLCRLSELVYFCLEMRYRRIGVAYCVDLEEPADILVRVLRRFFDVYPVSCKVGGQIAADPTIPPDDFQGSARRPVVACNPQGQAAILNQLETDLNVLVGLCMGADCAFGKASEAPVTTLFVKDRSLANNPIGAVYSDYYLNEAMLTTAGCN